MSSFHTNPPDPAVSADWASWALVLVSAVALAIAVGIPLWQDWRSRKRRASAVILRFYPAPEKQDPFELERTFHKLLDAAGHPRSRANAAGREWFSTSLEFLDTAADILGLAVKGNYGSDA